MIKSPVKLHCETLEKENARSSLTTSTWKKNCPKTIIASSNPMLASLDRELVSATAAKDNSVIRNVKSNHQYPQCRDTN